MSAPPGQRSDPGVEAEAAPKTKAGGPIASQCSRKARQRLERHHASLELTTRTPTSSRRTEHRGALPVPARGHLVKSKIGPRNVIRNGHKMNAEQARVFDAWLAEQETPAPEPPNILDRLRSGAWLDAQTFAPICWAVPGLIPEGFILFTGPPKAGKSWAILDVCLAVASGGRAFGRIGVGAARPVLLSRLKTATVACRAGAGHCCKTSRSHRSSST